MRQGAKRVVVECGFERYRIEALTSDRLEQAIALTRDLFWFGPDRRWAAADLRVSVSEKDSRKWYWVGVDEAREVVALTGLYVERRDRRGVVWLGWFGVHPSHRNRGLGTRLLDFTIREAIGRGYWLLRIYTSTDENETRAHGLYRRFGFVPDPASRRGEYFTLSKRIGNE